MSVNLKIQGYYLVLTDTGTSSEYIREKTAQLKFKVNGTKYRFFLDVKNNVGSDISYEQGDDETEFEYADIIDDRTGLAFVTNADLTDFLSGKLGEPIGGGGGGVQSVTGDGVDNTDPINPVLSFPDADEVDDTTTTNKFATQAQLDQIATNTSDIASKRDTTAQKNSIEDDAGDLQLVGDQLNPGNDQYYGTDGSGSKGFHNFPTTTGVQSVTGDGVGGTASNVVMTFPTPAQIGAKPDFTENTAFNKDFGTAAGEVMNAGTYDPNSVGADAFDYGNFLGTFQIKGTPQTVNLSSDIDNLSVTANIVDLTTSSQDRRITGIVAPPAGVNRVIFFYNQSSQYRIKFVHQSGSSNAANRIVLRGQAGTRNLLEFQMAILSYNHLLNRWYVSRIA